MSNSQAMCNIGCGLFQKQRGLRACIREQPCGVDQPTMTEYAGLVEGACLMLDAVFCITTNEYGDIGGGLCGGGKCGKSRGACRGIQC